MVHLEFESQRQRELHEHKNYEMFYVLNGKCEVMIDEKPVCLVKKDCIIINSGQKHSYSVGSDSLIAHFHIPYTQVVAETDENRDVFFLLNSLNCEKKLALERVRKILNQMVENSYSCEGDRELAAYQGFYALMSILFENFAHEEKLNTKEEAGIETDRRIREIVGYINDHYGESISLNALASKLYLTPTYLSKYIKQQLGISFMKLLTNVRLNHAEQALAHTNMPIAQIGLDVGFSSLTAFNRRFKERHGMTPSRYRKDHQKKASGNSKNSDIEAAEEGKLTGRKPDFHGNSSEKGMGIRNTKDAGEEDVPEENIIYQQILVEEVDENEKALVKRSWNHTINIGSVEELLYSDVQDHVLMLKNELHFRYVRIWDIYSPGLYLNEHQENQIYNFSRLDRALDFLVNNRLVPHIEVGNKPKKLMRDAKHYMKLPQEGDSPFKSEDTIRYFFSVLMRHLMHRYGATELDKWCIELWMPEEKIDIPGEWPKYNKKMLDDYLDQFGLLAETIRRFGMKLKLGGGGFSMRYGREWFDYVIHQWKRRPQQPDFISIYAYPYFPIMDGSNFNYRVMRTDFVQSAIKYAKSVIRRENMNCRLAVTEWNNTVFNGNRLNDSLFKGAWIMKNLVECLNLCDILSYWVGTDLYAESSDLFGFLGGGCGLLTKDGLKKPAWFAFEFMNSLERVLYQKNENVVVTRSKYKDWRIVCHNFKQMNYAYYMHEETEFKVEEVYNMLEDSRPLRLYFELPVLPKDEYRVKFLRVNRENGSIQDEWLKMSSPSYLDAEDLMYLRNRCVPQMTIRGYQEKEGKIAFTTILEPNEIQLIVVECLGRKQ